MNGKDSGGAEVRIKNLTKKFGKVVAVDNISLEVKENEFLTLLGPSGSGKTTTLMIIAGFETADSGEVYLNQNPIINIPSYKRNIGMVFQNYALFPHMNVFDNVAYPLTMRKISRSEIKRRVTEIINMVELADHMEKYPNQLSGGQQQRVALARALVFNPPLLLLDEPLGALDKNLREQMKLEIKRIQKTFNLSAIYVTHDQEEALTISDRIAVYDQGKILQKGTPEELYENPVSRFVANFIGTSNFMPVRFEGEEGNRMVWIDAEDESLRYTTRRGKEPPRGLTMELIIRPEKLFFVNSDRQGLNMIEGHILEVIYTGDRTRYRIGIRKSKEIEVNCQNRYGIQKYKVGDRVKIGWYVEDGKLLS